MTGPDLLTLATTTSLVAAWSTTFRPSPIRAFVRTGAGVLGGRPHNFDTGLNLPVSRNANGPAGFISDREAVAHASRPLPTTNSTPVVERGQESTHNNNATRPLQRPGRTT